MIRQAALDLLHRGGVSVPQLGGELVRRQLLQPGATIGQAYTTAREALDALATEGKAQKWPDGYCYTLPEKTPMAPTKERK